jgi:DNA-binding SARP family transcriptional activator
VSALRARLFGRFSVYRDDHDLPGFEPGKVKELFAFLLLHPGRPLSREYLADQLWSDSASSRKYLRQALWHLQQALEGVATTNPSLLRIEADAIDVDARADVWLDVWQFEAAWDRVAEIPGERLAHEDAATLQAAVLLYDGDLLEGWFQDWCLFERERLQVAYLAMLDKLMSYFESRRAYDAAVTFGERILRCDRAQERAHSRLMRLHYLAGDRTAALRQYDRCAAALLEELDIAPSRETSALRDEIRLDQVSLTRTPAPALAPAPAGGERLRNLLRAMSLLGDAQRVLEREIRGLTDATETRKQTS